VINLSDAELAILLWLLDLRRECNGATPYHRIGGGKPLGFGSVKISIKHLDLATGAARQVRYKSLFADPKYSELERQGKRYRISGEPKKNDTFPEVHEFVNAVFKPIEDKLGSKFEHLPHVAAFLQAARGYEDLPTHYPRMDEFPNPAGENFRWFTENNHGGRHALPALCVGGKGLPIDPS
jgi:hypothetical protein